MKAVFDPQKAIAVVTVGHRVLNEQSHFRCATEPVLEMLGFAVEYCYTDDHEVVIRQAINYNIEFRPHVEWLLLCDVDVFVVRPDRLRRWLLDIRHRPPALSGILQNANHIPGSPDYVAPGFALLYLPWWRGHKRELPAVKGEAHDLLGAHTAFVRERGGRVVPVRPASCLVPRWKLESSCIRYGIGTFYKRLGIVHVYCVRDEQQSKELCRWFGDLLEWTEEEIEMEKEE